MNGRDTVINVNSTFLPRVYDIRNNFGSYIQYVLNTSFLGKTNFTAGLRYDRNSYFGDAASPRLAIVNKPTERLTFKLQFGSAFRAPSNLEIHQAPLTFQLTTEKIRTYEINFIYNLSKTLTLQVNGFRNELRDVIILGNLSGFSADKNPGIHNVNGIESSLNFTFSKYVEGFTNFTYQNAREENLLTHVKGNIPGIARVKGNVGLTFRSPDAFALSLSGNWVGERIAQRTNPYGPIGGYALLNCVLSSKPLFNNMVTASLNVQNIFNTKWLDPGFRTADGNLYSTVLEQPGRSGLFKVAVNFK